MIRINCKWAFYLTISFCCNVAVLGCGNETKQESKRETGPDCVYYENRLIHNPSPLSVHILKIDIRKCSIQLVTAQGTEYEGETISSMAKRTHAYAGINGGFFVGGGKKEGIPVGILKVGNIWHSIFSSSLGAMGWKNGDQTTLFGQLNVQASLRIGDDIFPIDEVNKFRNKEQKVLYTSIPRKRPGVSGNGTEITIESNKLVSMNNNIVPQIPKGSYVYSIGSDAKIGIKNVQEGDSAQLKFKFNETRVNQSSSTSPPEVWEEMDVILGVGPLLVKDGKIISEYQYVGDINRGFINSKHPRTAICIDGENKWNFVVVDGRTQRSVGLSIPALADFMRSLGCVNALNLDGGGSSTMYFNGQIRNAPSGNPSMGEKPKERPAPNGLFVMPN